MYKGEMITTIKAIKIYIILHSFFFEEGEDTLSKFQVQLDLTSCGIENIKKIPEIS